MKKARFSTPGGPSDFLDGLSKMCAVFWGPDPFFCKALLDSRWWAPFVRLKADIPYSPRDAVSLAQQEIHAFSEPDLLFGHLEEAYVRLFVNRKGPLSAYLYASCYEGEEALMMGPPAVEMKKRLAGAGLDVAQDRTEPPDHLCIQLEYLYFLLEQGWMSSRGDLLEEAAAFTRSALLPWVSVVTARLNEGETGCPFYGLSASILLSFLQFISAVTPANATDLP